MKMVFKVWLTVALVVITLGQKAQAAIEFATASATVQETSGSATLTIVRTGAGTDAASITIVATHGTATANTDYDFSTTVLNWEANDIGSRTVTIPIQQDAVTEGSETAYFALTNVAGEVLGAQQTTQLIIADPNLAVATDQGLTPEQREAAVVLDDVCSQAGSSIEGCALLSELSDAEQAETLETILPRQVVQQASNSLVAQTGSTQTIRQRMQNVRAGNATPFANFMLLSGDQAVALDSLLQEAALAYRGGSAGEEGPGERWGVFLSGQVQTADQDSTTEILGYQSDSQQVTAGLDYRFGTRLFVGSAFSFSQSDTESNVDAGEQDSAVSILNLYGSYYFTDSFYLDLVTSVGASDYDMKRNYRFGDAVVAANSDTSGDQWGFSAALGFERAFGAWLLDSFARVETRQISIDDYTETGGAGLGLAVDEQEVESNQAVLGGAMGWVYSASYGVWIPKLTVEWVHELADDSRDITAQFVANPDAGTFALATVEPDRDYFNVGGTLVGTFAHGSSAYARYEVVVDRDDFIAETYELGVRMAF